MKLSKYNFGFKSSENILTNLFNVDKEAELLFLSKISSLQT